MERLKEQLRGSTMKSYVTTLAILAFLFLSLGCVAYITTEFLLDRLNDTAVWMHNNLPWSIPVYLILFSASMAMMLPSGPFAVALGFSYGFWVGLVIHLSSLFFAANIIFLLSGSYFKDWMEVRVRRSPKLGVMRQMVKGSGGFRFVVLSCQTPVPFGLFVGLFAISGINPTIFFAAILVGMLPMTIISLQIGDAAASNIIGGTSLPAEMAMLGIVGCVLFAGYVVVYGSRTLDDLDEASGGEVGTLMTSDSSI